MIKYLIMLAVAVAALNSHANKSSVKRPDSKPKIYDSCDDAKTAAQQFLAICRAEPPGDCAGDGEYLGPIWMTFPQGLLINCEVCAGEGGDLPSTPLIPFSCGIPDTLQDSSNIQKPQSTCGSIIQTSNQVIGEKIPIVGASFALYYFSSRVVGRSSDYTVKIPVTGNTPDGDVSSYSVKIFDQNNSQVYSQTVPSSPNQTVKYLWNGLDHYGNNTWGTVNFSSDIVAYGLLGYNVNIDKTVFVGSLKANRLGLGGWTPGIWHFYDFNSETLFRGDGSIRTVSTSTDSLGRPFVAEEDGSQVYYFDGIGRIVETKNGLTGATVYTFSYSGDRLLSITDSFTRTTQFAYTSGNLVSITAPNGKLTTVTLDANGYLASVTNPKSETYQMVYNSGGLLTSFRKPNGLVSTFQFDTDGNLIQDQNSLGNLTALTKQSNGVTTQSALLRSTANTVTNGRIGLVDYTDEVISYPSGSITTIRNSNVESKLSTPNSSRDVNYTWDTRFGQQARLPSSISISDFGVLNSNITLTQSVSDSSNPYSLVTRQIQTTTGPSIVTETYGFSVPGQYDVTETSKLGRNKKTTYDQYGRPLVSHIGPPNTGLLDTLYTYNGDLLAQVQTGTRMTSFQYDPYSRLLSSVTNALGEVTAMTYDQAERPTSQILPDLRVVQFTHDSSGNLTSISPPGRPAHSFSYFGNDMLMSYSAPEVDCITDRVTQYSYNLDKQLTSVSRPDGQVINYNYDATKGYLTSISGGISQQFGYDTNGRLVTKSLGSLNYNLGFQGDTVNEKTLVTTGNTLLYKYSISPDTSVGGRIGSELLTDASGSYSLTVVHSYDDDGYLTQVGDQAIQWDISRILLQGTILGSISDNYSYNDYREITGYQLVRNAIQIYAENLTRDGLGRVSQKVETINGVSNTYVYSYDASGRLSTVTKNGIQISSYQYDSNSNRIGGSINGINTAASYDNQDHMMDYGTDHYTYNNNGDLTEKMSTVTGATTSYQYDILGNLIQVTTSTKTIVYSLDPDLRRFEKRVNGAVVEKYAYDLSGHLVATLDSNNHVIKAFVYGTKSNVPEYFYDAGGIKYKIISDVIGSVKLVIRESDGVVLQQIDYDEFGRVIQDTNPGYIPFGFAGGLYDFETGLVRFGARDYDAQVGRWTTKDPLMFAAGDPNLYGYILNDPINKVDFSGKDPDANSDLANYFNLNTQINQLGQQAIIGMTKAYMTVTSAVSAVATAAVTLPAAVPAVVDATEKVVSACISSPATCVDYASAVASGVYQGLTGENSAPDPMSSPASNAIESAASSLTNMAKSNCEE